MDVALCRHSVLGRRRVTERRFEICIDEVDETASHLLATDNQRRLEMTISDGVERLSHRGRPASARILDVSNGYLREAKTAQDALSEHLPLVEMCNKRSIDLGTRQSAVTQCRDHGWARDLFDRNVLIFAEWNEADADYCDVAPSIMLHCASSIFALRYRGPVPR